MQAISSHVEANAITNIICLAVRVRNGARKRFVTLMLFINRSPLLHISVWSRAVHSPSAASVRSVMRVMNPSLSCQVRLSRPGPGRVAGQRRLHVVSPNM